MVNGSTWDIFLPGMLLKAICDFMETGVDVFSGNVFQPEILRYL